MLQSMQPKIKIIPYSKSAEYKKVSFVIKPQMFLRLFVKIIDFNEWWLSSSHGALNLKCDGGLVGLPQGFTLLFSSFLQRA